MRFDMHTLQAAATASETDGTAERSRWERVLEERNAFTYLLSEIRRLVRMQLVGEASCRALV